MIQKIILSWVKMGMIIYLVVMDLISGGTNGTDTSSSDTLDYRVTTSTGIEVNLGSNLILDDGFGNSNEYLMWKMFLEQIYLIL